MNSQKVTFENAEGHQLTGRLDLPADRHPHNFALFAHCFTCSKNLSAVKRISRALNKKGFGVLRFDFTGLGESHGDFSDSNFSGNVNDLIQAAKFLSDHYHAPSLLIGHSLGGAAVIMASKMLDSVKAVATIGAPSDPKHVKHLFSHELETISEHGIAQVNLGGRPFNIKQQFVRDLEDQPMAQTLKKLHKALLILHSPQDQTVELKNAEELYHAARHPKSFVTLDGADHLLTNPDDAGYAGHIIAEWVSRYIELPEESNLRTTHQVVASLDADDGFTTQMKIGNHFMVADEPISYGGNDFGPSPYEFVSAGLSACTAMTVQMYVKRKGWDLKNIEVHTNYAKDHADDCANCEQDSAKIDTFDRLIRLEGDLTDAQISRILEIADKCPVHRSLTSTTQIRTQLI